jgi:hypothetical protein
MNPGGPKGTAAATLEQLGNLLGSEGREEAGCVKDVEGLMTALTGPLHDDVD